MYKKTWIFISCFILTFILSSILIIISGHNPFIIYITIFQGAFVDVRRISEILVKACPLLITALGVSIAFKGGFWNIGTEGQIYMGAIAAAGTGLLMKSSCPLLIIPVFMASFTAGGLWALIPGLLKVKLGINEIIITMMMNYIAIYMANYTCHTLLRDPSGYLPQTGEISKGAYLPVIIEKTRLHSGIIIAIIGCIIIYILLKYTTAGYKIKAAGANPEAAYYGGINIYRMILIAAFISGGMAGIAGMGEVCGIYHKLLDGISPGYGYSAIVIALLGKLHPAGIFIASIFFSSLEIGADYMQRTTGIPSSLADVIEAMLVIFILGSEFINVRREM